MELPPGQVFWLPKGCSAAAWWSVGETAALHETERTRYALLHQDSAGFFGTMSTAESRHEIYNWEG